MIVRFFSKLPKIFSAFLISFIAVLSAAQTAHAASVTLDAVYSGWYLDNGSHTNSNLNYLTGSCPTVPCTTNGGEHRGFFIFDLTSVTDPIVSATLSLFNPDYTSGDTTETLDIYDVSTDPVTLAQTAVGQTGYFDDLGTGVKYGSTSVSNADDGQAVLIPLNAGALLDLNNASGYFAFGARLSTLQDSTLQYLFGNSSGTSPRKLLLETQDAVVPSPSVPEPSSILLAGMGLLLGLAFKTRR
ncbi:MAG TPA: PEP-CTERM sorting domain-containing protein [Verrucomicrobiae bacterium]|jgi:hypothetical protein|nr:PEP-CTERM sorting domain-containing protein [Verrucomicrobiae bacterium]